MNKEDLDEIMVPDTLDQAIVKGIKKAETRMRKNKVRNKKIRVLFGGMAVCSLLGVLFFNRGLDTNMYLKDNQEKSKGEQTWLFENQESVKYSALQFKESSEVIKPKDFYANRAAADIIFVEDFEKQLLGQSELVIKGTIQNIHYKTYNYSVYDDNNYKTFDYSVYDDKFEKNGVYYKIQHTVQYEVRINKIYYSALDVKVGDVFLIENTCDFIDPILELVSNRQYILPICCSSDTFLYDYEKYAEGDASPESTYSIIYPYVPQIQITENEEYVFCNMWKSLLNGKEKKLIMDSDMDYTDKRMRIRNASGFETDFQKIVDRCFN